MLEIRHRCHVRTGCLSFSFCFVSFLFHFQPHSRFFPKTLNLCYVVTPLLRPLLIHRSSFSCFPKTLAVIFVIAVTLAGQALPLLLRSTVVTLRVLRSTVVTLRVLRLPVPSLSANPRLVEAIESSVS